MLNDGNCSKYYSSADSFTQKSVVDNFSFVFLLQPFVNKLLRGLLARSVEYFAEADFPYHKPAMIKSAEKLSSVSIEYTIMFLAELTCLEMMLLLLFLRSVSITFANNCLDICLEGRYYRRTLFADLLIAKQLYILNRNSSFFFQCFKMRWSQPRYLFKL